MNFDESINIQMRHFSLSFWVTVSVVWELIYKNEKLYTGILKKGLTELCILMLVQLALDRAPALAGKLAPDMPKTPKPSCYAPLKEKNIQHED